MGGREAAAAVLLERLDGGCGSGERGAYGGSYDPDVLPQVSRAREDGWDAGEALIVRYDSRSVMPAIAYTLDMNFRTGGSYGINETLLSSAVAALVFGILSVQPLTIVGVTGTLLDRSSLLQI